MFGKIPGSAPSRSRGIWIRKVRPVPECGRGLVYYTPKVWTHHLKQCRIAATTGGVPADIQTGHLPPPPTPRQFSTDNVQLFEFRGMLSLLSFSDFFLVLPSISPCFLLSPLFLPSFFFISVSVILFHFLPVFFIHSDEFFRRSLRHNPEHKYTKSSLSWGEYMPPFPRITSDLLPVTYATDQFRRV